MSELKDYATDRQWEYEEAAQKLGIKGAARELSVNEKTIYSARKAIRRKAALAGYAPESDMTHPSPPGFNVKGTSTLYDDEGNMRLQWVKTNQDKDAQLALLIDRIEGLNIKPLKPVKPPKQTDDSYLTIYPLGDPHIGMYAWAREAGEDFDCDIARQDLCNAMSHLVQASKPSKECLILNVGDFFHADDPSNATPQNKNPLDVDGRWTRVLEMGFHVLVDLIHMALKKHEIVRVRSLPGNHDPKSVVPLTLFMGAWFKDEPRVVIEESTRVHQYQSFGQCLFGFTHGDKIKKPTELGALMATDQPEAWGGSKFRYWLHGHFHSRRVLEVVGCVVEGVRNLPPNDAWHQGEGYRSGRDMMAITYHKNHGEVSRVTCDISTIREAQ